MIYYRIQVDHTYFSYRTWQNRTFAEAEACVWKQMHPDSEIRVVRFEYLEGYPKSKTVYIYRAKE